MEIQRPRRSCILVLSSRGGLNIAKDDTIHLPKIFEYLELNIYNEGRSSLKTDTILQSAGIYKTFPLDIL